MQRQAFEYLDIGGNAVEERNVLGLEGWELVAVSERDTAGAVMFYFKRQLPPLPVEAAVPAPNQTPAPRPPPNDRTAPRNRR
jgi:hypothetical protein